MTISDNLLRTISHAYTALTPTQFIIKADILVFKDYNMILKSIEVAHMLAILTENPTTETEKKFYRHKISVETYNREIVEERKNNPKIITIKESILKKGLVHSTFLGYMYKALVKYEPTNVNLYLLEENLHKTHKKLTEILGTRGEATPALTKEQIQTEINNLNSEAEALYKSIKEVTTDVQATNKSILDIKETLANTIQNIKTNQTNTQDTEEIQQNLNTLYQDVTDNINKQVKEALEKRENTLKETVTKAITDQLESTRTHKLRTHTRNTLEKKIGTLLSSIKTDLEKDINNSGNSISVKTELESISTKIQNLTKNTNKLAEDTTIANIEKDLYKLAKAVYRLYTNNKDRAAAMEMDTLRISNSLKIPTEYFEDDEED